jgi:hypothetical protein
MVRIPASRMKADMASIMDIHPAALVTPLPLAAPLALPATMEMKAVRMVTAAMTMINVC